MAALLVTAAGGTGAAVLAAGSAAADPPASDWAKVRMCESSGNYAINTGNGYYGAYQFNQATWTSVGGQGRPDQASPREQDYRALYLYRMRGWQPWTCGAGLREDGDARSGRVPTYAESAYMGGAGTVPVVTPPVVTPPVVTPPVVTPPVVVPPPPAPVPGGGGVPSDPGTFAAWPVAIFFPGQCDPAAVPFQRRMATFGYATVPDGCITGETSRAILDEQRANTLPVTGVLGPLTWVAAWYGVDPDTSPGDPNAWPGALYLPGQCDPAIGRWQRSLASYGRAVDTGGCLTPQTLGVLDEVQRANGLPALPLLGPLSWMAAFAPDAQH
ncbi:hypothetical protein GCM10027047_20960 [Rhodococcus aerolatus]